MEMMGNIMISGSFDPVTSREVIGNDFSTLIEAKARADADRGVFELPDKVVGTTYWDSVQHTMREVIYKVQYDKRVARNSRKEIGERI